MTITVSKIEKINVVEDGKTEFKSSIFVAPGMNAPSMKQMREIAASIAAFMNAEGGCLYIGVSDDGTISGIEADLNILAHSADMVQITTSQFNDSGFIYDGSTDKYQLKIRHILQAFLSPNHRNYLGEIRFAQMGEVTRRIVCRIEIRKCNDDDFVYFISKDKINGLVEEIVVRSGNRKIRLHGRARDEFVKERWAKSIFVQIAEMKAGSPSLSADALLSGIENLLVKKQVGIRVVVEGGQPLTKDGLGPIKSPGGLVIDGKHAGDVKSWKECYLRLCCELNKMDAAKFDSLPDDEFFGKWFKREEPKLLGQKRAKKCTGCYPDKLGTKPDIRAMEVSGKIYFIDDDKIVHRLLAHCGVDASRISIRAR